jgi:iron complex transport system substrate-binding protein
MPSHPAPPRRRRARAAAAVLVVVLPVALLAGCSDDGPQVNAHLHPPDGPWSWTDDLGQQVHLDQAPTRIAAYGDEAAALWHFGVVPTAVFDYTDPQSDPNFFGLPLKRTEVVGTTYGDIDLDRLEELKPDLIVTSSEPGDTADEMFGFATAGELAEARKIAPVIAVAQAGSARLVVETNERLAAALGVDVGAGSAVAADRKQFELASHELTQAASSGLTVMPAYADYGGLYVLDSRDDPTMSYVEDLGVEFEKEGGDDDYWEILDWEHSDRYHPDIVLMSQKGGFTGEQLRNQETFGKVAAVARQQVHPWRFPSMDYLSLTAYLKELSQWLVTDQDVG